MSPLLVVYVLLILPALLGTLNVLNGALDFYERIERRRSSRHQDAPAVARGMQMLAEARQPGTLPAEESDRLAVEEVRVVCRARRPRMARRGRDPWTGPDPQPGELEADLDGIDPRHVESHPGDLDAKVTITPAAEDDAAGRW